MRAPIRLKLLAAFGLNLVLMLALGVFTIAQIASISARATSVAENSVVSLAIVNQITLAITEYRGLQAEHIAQSDAAAMTTIEQEMQALEDRMSGALQHFAPLADAADEQTALQEIRARWMDWVARNHQALIPLSRSKAIDPGRRRNQVAADRR